MISACMLADIECHEVVADWLQICMQIVVSIYSLSLDGPPQFVTGWRR